VQGGRYTTITRLLAFGALVVLFTGDALAARGLTTLNLTCRYAREETTVTEQGVPPLTLGGTCQKTPEAKF
jgi:hypothetical protein